MNIMIFKNTISTRKTSTFVWALSMGLFGFLFTAMHQNFAGNITQFADTFPEGLSAFIGDIALAAEPAGFLGVELYGLFLPMVLAVVGLGFGASAIGREEEAGTLEVLLASPISRSRIIMQKFAAIKTSLFIIAAATWVAIAIGSVLFVFNVDLFHVALASLSAFLLGLIYATAALCAQSITGKRGIGIGFGAGLLAITYFADIVSKLIESLSFLKYVSPFYYFDVSNVLFGKGSLSNFIILATISIVFYLIAHTAFVQRDTGV